MGTHSNEIFQCSDNKWSVMIGPVFFPVSSQLMSFVYGFARLASVSWIIDCESSVLPLITMLHNIPYV